MNNVYMMAEKELANRYDFKDTPAFIEWLGDKSGFRVTGANEWQIDSIIDIILKKLSSREQSSKVLDLSKGIVISNLKATKEIPFISGLDQDKAKQIAKLLRDNLPKVKPQIQGDTVRVMSNSKDDLQKAMQIIRSTEFDFPINFINYR